MVHRAPGGYYGANTYGKMGGGCSLCVEDKPRGNEVVRFYLRTYKEELCNHIQWVAYGRTTGKEEGK